MTRNLRALCLIGSAILVAAAVHLPAVAKKKNDGYLNPRALYKLVKKSKVLYRIDSLDNLDRLTVEDIPGVMWPQLRPPLTLPRVTNEEDGSRDLSEYPIAPGCKRILEQAEPHFDRRDFKMATAFYEEAIRQHPDCYIVYSHIGDTHYFRDEYDEALEWYDKAIERNPHDYRTWFYRANAYWGLRDKAHAVESYARALALAPRVQSVVQVIQAIERELGVRYDDHRFTPRSLARQEGEAIAIYADLEKPYWATYALCKGVWLGEPGHREARLGSTDPSWSTIEDTQCLLSMLENYIANREDGTVEEDPDLQRILAIAEDGMLNEFVIYELGARVYPNVVLLLSDDEREEMVKFVRAWVLPDTPPPGAGTANADPLPE